MSLLTALMTAALLQSTPTPDLSWLAGYWLDCSGGREASETWSDPRLGLGSIDIQGFTRGLMRDS